jgi:hypothetical protein
MKIFKVLLIPIFVLGFYGCGSGVRMVKESTGESLICEGRLSKVNACINKYEGEGYRRFGVTDTGSPAGGGYRLRQCPPGVFRILCIQLLNRWDKMPSESQRRRAGNGTRESFI